MITHQVAQQVFSQLPLGPLVLLDSSPQGFSLQHRQGPWNTYYHGPIYAPDCRNCPLQLDPKVWPDGPIPARLVYIGEEPGHDEVVTGKGFIGGSGKLLWQLAALHGIRREEVWVTNTELCKSRDILLSNRGELHRNLVQAMAARACRRRLISEVLYVTQGMQHPVLQPLGKWALWSLTGMPDPSIYNYRGARLDINLEVLYANLGSTTEQAMRRVA